MKNVANFRGVVAGAVACAAIFCTSGASGQAAEHAWEKEIRAFEKEDQEKPPEPGGVVFVGSSTIRLWDLAKHFPELKCVNRGFGGSHMADSAHFADRIVTPYRPRMVVVYAGGNDLNAGKTPEEVLRDFRAFVKAVHAGSPAAKIVYIALKPTIARWSHDDKLREANALIKEVIEENDKLIYLDAYGPFLGEDGQPRADLLQPDNLHLNEDGYKLLTSLVRPLVAE